MAQFLALIDWLRSAGDVWLFLLILAFVVGAVWLWSGGLGRNGSGDRVHDD